jgi:hypothetical protein
MDWAGQFELRPVGGGEDEDDVAGEGDSAQAM